jgi:hypothetical protein
MSLPDNKQPSQETDIHATGGIQTAVSASERPHTHALDHAAIGIGCESYWEHKFTLGKIQAISFEVGGMCSDN